jgi:hypothetical protein
MLFQKKPTIFIPSVTDNIFTSLQSKQYYTCAGVAYPIDYITRVIIKENVKIMEIERLRTGKTYDDNGDPILQLIIDNVSVKEWIVDNYIGNGWKFKDHLDTEIPSLSHRNLFKKYKSNKKSSNNKYIRKKNRK